MKFVQMFKILILIFIPLIIFGQQADTLNITPDTLLIQKEAVKKELPELNITSLSSNTKFITPEEIKFNNYQFLGDHFFYHPFSYSAYSGFYGLPHENTIYGVPLNQTSILENGIEKNSRLSTGFDFHMPHLEQIDSIEIIPSYKGFMFGNKNNSASINLIMKDKFKVVPYSRLKYFEGVNGLAFLDVFLSNQFYQKLQLSFAVNSWKIDDSYNNSAASLWNLTGQIKYLATDNFNILFRYNFTDKKNSYNGGADYDSIKNTFSNIDLILYDEIRSPVRFLADNYRNKEHNSTLTFFYKPFEFNFNEITFYSKNLNYYYNQNENGRDPRYPTSYFESDEKIEGLKVSSIIDFNTFSLKGIAGIEQFEYKSGLIQKDNLKYLSGELSTNFFDSLFQTSFFAKTLFYNAKTFPGVGGEILSNINENLSFYAGLSYFRNYLLSITSNDNNILSAEGGFRYINKDLDLAFSLFTRDKNLFYVSNYNSSVEKQITGTQIIFNYKISQFLLETKTQYYLTDEIKSVPQFISDIGFYFKGNLFENNLLLKSGLRTKLYGEQTYFNYNHLTGSKEFNLSDKIPFAYQLDFIATGEIQKLVMVYFIWENLTDSKYYLIPYYPMPLRSIRFGLTWEFLN